MPLRSLQFYCRRQIHKKVNKLESVSTGPVGAVRKVIYLGGGVEEDWEE